MAIERWQPQREMRSLSRFLDDIFENLGRWETGWPNREGLVLPLLDVSEDTKDVVIKVELPGVNKEDIKLTIENNVLTISGEKKTEKIEEGKNYHILERRFGSFHRMIALPTSVDAEKISATHKDGILTINLPKKEDARAKEIPISTT